MTNRESFALRNARHAVLEAEFRKQVDILHSEVTPNGWHCRLSSRTGGEKMYIDDYTNNPVGRFDDTCIPMRILSNDPDHVFVAAPTDGIGANDNSRSVAFSNDFKTREETDNYMFSAFSCQAQMGQEAKGFLPIYTFAQVNDPSDILDPNKMYVLTLKEIEKAVLEGTCTLHMPYGPGDSPELEKLEACRKAIEAGQVRWRMAGRTLTNKPEPAFLLSKSVVEQPRNVWYPKILSLLVSAARP